MSGYAEVSDALSPGDDDFKDAFKIMERRIRQFSKAAMSKPTKAKKRSLLGNACDDTDCFQWSEVVDPRDEKHMVSVTTASCPVMLCGPDSRLVQVARLPDGFYVITRALSLEAQLLWARRALMEYSKAEHTNLTNLSSLQRSENRNTDSTTSDVPAVDGAPGDWDRAASGDGFKAFFKLRWSCLGYHYDWTARKYQRDVKSPFPADLALLCRHIAQGAGADLEPEAAIVNYYPRGASMGGHLDDAEHALTRPIVSLSLGCAALFLLGGRTKDVSPVPILLRSGDAVVMARESRLCYHGVPLILPPGEVLGGDGVPSARECGDSPDMQKVGEFLRTGRININVRQVRHDVAEGGAAVWEDKAGSGAAQKSVTALA